MKKERGHVTDFGVIDIRGIMIFEKIGEKLGAREVGATEKS